MIPVEVIHEGSNSIGMANLKQYAGRSGQLKKYRGSFPSSIVKIIRELVAGQSLNLYSGRSEIGTVRVDLECPEATHKMSVEDFITSDRRHWDWVIIDPPYKIKNLRKLREYADARPLQGNVLLQDRLRLYLRGHADNVLWLDYCSPTLKGFIRAKIWLVLPGKCFQHCRIFTWLRRSGIEMPLFVGSLT